MDLLDRAARLGIETSFIDATGRQRTIDAAGLARLVNAIPEAFRHPLGLAPELHPEGPVSVRVATQTALPVAWRLLGDGGAIVLDGVSEDRQWDLPTVSPGVYRLAVEDAAGACDEDIVVVAGRAFHGNFSRAWLLAVQLYGVRSSRNWGIGDFTDLEDLIRWAADAGAAGIGLNPLHVLFDDCPQDCSPYSPNSRLFLNPLYIDVTRLPGFDLAAMPDHAARIDVVRDAELVDYAGVASLKRAGLQAAFRVFDASASPAEQADFKLFRAERGHVLSRFACFEVLRKKYQGPWWEWPEHWRAPNDAVLDELRSGADATDLRFVEFVQWCADRQLSACRQLASELGLPVGLYLDIAVGVKADGFDAWNEQAAISRHLSVGAPPDILNTAGQDWGLAGFNAPGLVERSFEPFRDMLAASMRYAGAVRLDHVLGLNRIYLVPAGSSPEGGAYVRMPFEALLAVTALESARHRCIVIGEDLGTVPDGFREKLAAWGVWSYRVMMFERGHDGAFHPAHLYPPHSLVTFNTHDLPTYHGWTSAHDIALKHGLGIDPGESRESRSYAADMLKRALNLNGHDAAPFESVLQYLAQTPSRVMAVAIEDLLGVLDQPNIPGTIDQHPNWRRRLPISREDWARQIDPQRLREALAERGPPR